MKELRVIKKVNLVYFELYKKLGHNIVVFQCQNSAKQLSDLIKYEIKISNKITYNERRTDFLNQNINRQIKELQQLQQLEQLQQLQRLDKIKFLNKDFKNVEIKDNDDEVIIYFDPPYRNTSKYIEDTLHTEIDQYFKNLPYTAFMSEYSSPFKSILSIKKIQLFDNSKEKKTYATEHLFINKY